MRTGAKKASESTPMSRTFRIRHLTEYNYDQDVRFGPHRLLLRPRDGHDLRVLETSLAIAPTAKLRWHFGTFGHSVAMAEFTRPASTLSIESILLLRRYPMSVEGFVQEDLGGPYPIRYSADDQFDLSPMMRMGNTDQFGIVQSWMDSVLPMHFNSAFTFLRTLSDVINTSFLYSARDELGTQSAATTIERGTGTCRDYAYLFIEAARARGFAARFVTGYLYDAATDGAIGLIGGGATHAWAEAFIPNVGWIEFDPTNRIVGGASLIRVAATRSPEQASPISGSFNSEGGRFVGMNVEISVEEIFDKAV